MNTNYFRIYSLIFFLAFLLVTTSGCVNKDKKKPYFSWAEKPYALNIDYEKNIRNEDKPRTVYIGEDVNSDVINEEIKIIR